MNSNFLDFFFVLLYHYAMTNIMNQKQSKSLFSAFLQLKTNEEVGKFCRDLMTESEIQEFASRWQVAQELDSGLPQRQVSKKTGTSIATVTRVNQWLKRGMGGYKLVLSRLSKIDHHRPRSVGLHPEI